ncbi:MAG TPA: DUF5985 family protein [Blastocatellia bacterium]|nr:DUF5985 family protein [Blastocatellia bacterium]
MAEAVYILCILTSLACAWLLLRSYRKTRAKLLLWCALCFVGLLLNNLLLFIDIIVVPDVDLSIWRSVTGLAALCFLLYGLIWDSR